MEDKVAILEIFKQKHEALSGQSKLEKEGIKASVKKCADYKPLAKLNGYCLAVAPSEYWIARESLALPCWNVSREEAERINKRRCLRCGSTKTSYDLGAFLGDFILTALGAMIKRFFTLPQKKWHCSVCGLCWVFDNEPRQ